MRDFAAGDLDRESAESHEPALRQSIEKADMNVLRMAIYQETFDEDLARVRLEPLPIWGGSYIATMVAEEDHDLVKRKALKFLGRPRSKRAPPTREEARRLMEIFEGKAISDAAANYGYEELAFESFPRRAEWSRPPEPQKLDRFHVLIVGAGMSGIAMAVQLEQLGISYEIIERQSEIGGTWALNSYPGARVDIPSANYQYKFVKNYPWKHVYATQGENQEYLIQCAINNGLRDKLSLETELVSARWDDQSCLWHLTLRNSDDETKSVSCNVLISASGLFSTPKLPDIEGISDFEGKILRTTAWDRGYQYQGKRIGLIGNGSSGVQVMPQLARDTRKLVVFQRTPQWIMGVDNYFHEVSPETRWLCDNVPNYWNWYCYAGYLPTVQLRGLFEHDREWQASGGRISERNDALRQTIMAYIEEKLAGRPDLIAKSLPTHAPWGRRLVIDSGWYEALKRPNVELETSGIARVTSTGVVTNDGTEHELDALVLALGFQTSRYLWPAQYVGRNGVTPADLWSKDGPRAYLGLVMPGFPNFFMIYGAPNSQPVGGTVSSWSEIWARYISQALIAMIEQDITSMECKKSSFDMFNAELDAEMATLIWEQEGQGSYFINEHGRQGNNMPFETDLYYEMLQALRLSDYELSFGRDNGASRA